MGIAPTVLFKLLERQKVGNRAIFQTFAHSEENCDLIDFTPYEHLNDTEGICTSSTDNCG